jgi:hypothetical protein
MRLSQLPSHWVSRPCASSSATMVRAVLAGAVIEVEPAAVHRALGVLHMVEGIALHRAAGLFDGADFVPDLGRSAIAAAAEVLAGDHAIVLERGEGGVEPVAIGLVGPVALLGALLGQRLAQQLLGERAEFLGGQVVGKGVGRVGQDRVLVIEAARHVAADLVAHPLGLFLGRGRGGGELIGFGRSALAEQAAKQGLHRFLHRPEGKIASVGPVAYSGTAESSLPCLRRLRTAPARRAGARSAGPASAVRVRSPPGRWSWRRRWR